MVNQNQSHQFFDDSGRLQAGRAINQLVEEYGSNGVVPTNLAAWVINRQPQTLRKWSCLDCAPNGIRPIRINGRLAWRISDLQRMLEV